MSHSVAYIVVPGNYSGQNSPRGGGGDGGGGADLQQFQGLYTIMTIEAWDMEIHEEKLGQSGDLILSSHITISFIIDALSLRRNNAT